MGEDRPVANQCGLQDLHRGLRPLPSKAPTCTPCSWATRSPTKPLAPALAGIATVLKRLAGGRGAAAARLPSRCAKGPASGPFFLGDFATRQPLKYTRQLASSGNTKRKSAIHLIANQELQRPPQPSEGSSSLFATSCKLTLSQAAAIVAACSGFKYKRCKTHSASRREAMVAQLSPAARHGTGPLAGLMRDGALHCVFQPLADLREGVPRP